MIYKAIELKRNWNYVTKVVMEQEEIYISFEEDGYTIYSNENNDIGRKNGQYISKTGECKKTERLWSRWNNIEVTIQILSDENKVQLTLPIWGIILLLDKKDADEIALFYKERNENRQNERGYIDNYIDESLLDISENLLVIIEEDVLLETLILGKCEKVYLTDDIVESADYHYRKKDYGLKGKEKKSVEEYNKKLTARFLKLSKVINNFVDIIMEEKGVKEYIAKAVAWKCIRKKAIEYYSQVWITEYETHLELSYEDCNNEYEYIQNVILCNDIDIEHSKNVLIYYILSQGNAEEINLYEHFEFYYKKIREIKESVNSDDIKNKLKTKQKRRISKYSIDDVDLMTGAEFEEFVGLLFKKMGYSSQVTKQSGDQGLDVIATKNGTKIGIQAKCYSNTVGNSAVQEAVAGKSFYNCDKVIVITNNYFTPAAEELAQSNSVILWNRDMLKEKIKELM